MPKTKDCFPHRGVNIKLRHGDCENIYVLCKKFPSLSFREILVLYKYIPHEGLERAVGGLIDQIDKIPIEIFLARNYGLQPLLVHEELYG